MSDNKMRPQDRWNEKNHYITKGFKMRREFADEFAKACEAAGVSQSGQIVKMMTDFINKQRRTKK